jgi:capsular polysaccharide transport system permease protein
MNLKASAMLQARVVFALLLQRVRSEYSGSRAGYLWALVEPMAWIFVLKFMLSMNGSRPPPLGDSFEVFVVTGVAMARTWRQSANQIANIIFRRKRLSLPSTFHSDLVLAVWILEMLTGIVVMGILLVVLTIFGFDATPANIMTCLAAYGFLAFYTLGFGMTLGLIITLAPGLRYFQHILMLVLFMTCGFSFLMDRMPIALRSIFSWNPVFHCIEFLREGFYAGYECHNLDLVYVLAVTIVMILIGTAGERALRHKKEIRTDGDVEEIA